MGFIFMAYEINFCETKEQLKHLGEVVTGKADGSPTGADIDTSTLQYTGQTRKTLTALEAEYQEAIDNAQIENYAGLWPDTGGSANKGETWQTQTSGTPTGQYFRALQNTSVAPVNDNENWREVVNTESVTTAQNDIVGGSIFKGSNGKYVQNGDVASDASFFRVDIDGGMVVRVVGKSGERIASGVISNLNTSSIPYSVTVGGVEFWMLDNRYPFNDEEVYINSFWADKDGNNDSSNSLDAVASFIRTLHSKAPAPGEGNTFTGNTVTIRAKKGLYRYSKKFNPENAYLEIDFENSIFEPLNFAVADDFFIENNTMWNGSIKNYKIRGQKNNIKLSNANLGLGQILIDGVQMSGGDVYLDTECRSTRVTVQNYRLDRVKHPAIIRAGDIVKFKQGWFKPGVLESDYTGFFRILAGSEDPKLIVSDMFYNPQPQTALDVFFVEIRDNATVDIDCSLFGGEPGQVPAIGWFADSTDVATGGRGGTIRLRDTSYFSSQSSPTSDPTGRRAMIELYALPNTILLENIAGLPEGSDQRGLIFFREDFQTFENAKSFGAGTQIWFDNRIGHRGVGEYITDEAENLAEFVRSENPVFYKRTGDVNNVTTEEISIPNDDNRLRRTFRLTAYLASSSQADAYSEYLFQSSFSGGVSSLSAIYEGSAGGAPRVELNGALLNIRTNTDGVMRQIRYEIQKVGSPTGGF